jgi:hypothetical protein
MAILQASLEMNHDDECTAGKIRLFPVHVHAAEICAKRTYKGEEKHASLLEEQFENNGSKGLWDAAMQGQVRFGSLLNGAQRKNWVKKNDSSAKVVHRNCLGGHWGLWSHKLLYGIFVVSKLEEQ